LQPAQPIAVTFAASSEAIDAFPGTKRGSPRIVPNETKLSITDCASRGSARFVTFEAAWHCFLLSLSRSRCSFLFAVSWLVRVSDPCSLGQSRPAAQLSVSRSRVSNGVTKRYEGLGSSALSRPLRDESEVNSKRSTELREGPGEYPPGSVRMLATAMMGGALEYYEFMVFGFWCRP
jgi:hypothetical protein